MYKYIHQFFTYLSYIPLIYNYTYITHTYIKHIYNYIQGIIFSYYIASIFTLFLVSITSKKVLLVCFYIKQYLITLKRINFFFYYYTFISALCSFSYLRNSAYTKVMKLFGDISLRSFLSFLPFFLLLYTFSHLDRQLNGIDFCVC